MKVAPIAPNNTCPSMPIFHRPVLNVMTRARPAKHIIVVIRSVLENLSKFPNAPSNIV